MRIGKKLYRFDKFNSKKVNAVLGYAASLMLAGVPPEVCENTITEVVTTVRKSIASLIG
jgi:hypothetical protein